MPSVSRACSPRRQSACSMAATTAQFTATAPAWVSRMQVVSCDTASQQPLASYTAQTSWPRLSADTTGRYRHTSAVTPAMMSFLRPVASTVRANAGSSKASIGPGRWTTGASGNMARSSGMMGPFGPSTWEPVSTVGSRCALAVLARARTLERNWSSRMSCTPSMVPVWWSISSMAASSAVSLSRKGMVGSLLRSW